ncbi:hypothetical protein [Amycolatopsis ultiminotia]
MASKGAPEWHGGSEQATKLAQQHSEVSGRVQQLSAGLESVWTGGGADAAQARIRPLADVSESASQTFTANSQTVSGVAHGFDQMKASLQPMPETPPHKNFLDEMAFWKTTDTEQQIKNYNEVGQQNLAKYQSYADQAQSAGQGLKTDYGQLADFGDGKVDIGSSDKSAVAHGKGPGVSSRGKSDVPESAAGGPTFSPGQSGGTTTSPGGGVTPPPGYQPGTGPGDGTTTSGWTPPSANPVSGPGNGSSWVPPSSLPTGGGSGGGGTWSPGLVGGFGSGGGLTGGGSESGGGSGGSGAGGRGGGTGAGGRGGAAGRLGAGPGAGAGAAEEAVGRGSAGAAARGTTGSRGAPGMGGMGAGKGGKGEEDKEHQRKYGLDDDSAFDLVDDEDGRLRDPRTGLPPTPPTIGG